MRKRYFLKVVAFAMTICLEFSNLSMTTYASQVLDETKATEVQKGEEYEGAGIDEHSTQEVSAQAASDDEIIQGNTEETSSVLFTEEEITTGEESSEEVSEEESIEKFSTEELSTEELSTEEEITGEESTEELSTEEETTKEQQTEEITTEEVSTEELSTEEETTEEETTEELTLEFLEEELLDGATPESDFTWEGNKITKYNGTAKNVVIPEKAYAIGQEAFANNKNIESVTLSKNITEINGYAFSYCSNLHTVIIQTTKLRREDGCGYNIFDGCSINKVEFAEETTYIPDKLFWAADFQGGTSITIPADVTSIGNYVFYGVKNLTKVNFAGNKVTQIGREAFNYTGIKNIDLPESLCVIREFAFSNCQSLQEIIIPEKVTEIGTSAFEGCSNLTTVKINSTKLTGEYCCGYNIFNNCNINKVEFAEGTTYIPNSLFWAADFQGGTSITIPAGVTSIGSYAFYGVRNLTKVNFAGNKVTQIGREAFSDTGIENIDLPESLCAIKDFAFYNCKSLRGIEIPEKVTEIGTSAFEGCSNLDTVKINTKKLNQTNGCGFNIFYGCMINHVEFAEGTTYIPDKLFWGAGFQGGMEIVIPENVISIGNYTFSGARNLARVTFAGNKITEIGREVFEGTGLETIDLPEALKTIGSLAFNNCSGLQEIVIPGKVTSIESWAFDGCTGLSKVVIPASVQAIGYNGFKNNSYLKVYAVKNSYAYNWAKENGFNLVESYAIKYALNGGVNGSGNPTAYEKGENLTFKEPTKKGYTFAGWYTDNSFKNKFTYSTSMTGNLTLYAKWNINTYNIHYAVNGGTLAKNSPTTYTVATTVTLKNPSRTGYTFTGWYTDSKCAQENKITKIEKGRTGDITLYAGWKEYSYTIKFAANGSKVSGTQEPVKDCAYSKNITLAKCAYTRNGYTFVGWNTMANGKGTSYADKATVSGLTAKNNATITLYAIWKENTYNITYNLNGGTNHAKNPASYTITKNITFSNPTREGYTFKGWYADAGYTKKITSIKSGSTGAVTVYAKWEVNKYTIAFTANGGKGKMNSITGCEYGKSYALTRNAFTREGYTFKGWNTNAKGTGTWYSNATSVKNLTSVNNKTVTLYAVWDEITYSITYQMNGGTNHAKNPSAYAVVRGVTLSNPVREGYTFKGWYTDAGYTQKITAIKKGSTGAVTVYAKWEVNKYTIKFSANGGSGKMNSMTGCEYAKSYPLTENAFTRKGYTFKGWNTNAKGTGTWYSNAAGVKNLTSVNNKTITLYAVWEEITYGITYQLNGGTNHAKNPSAYAVVRGVTLSNPVREGYTFKGWYNDAGFTQKITAIKKGNTGAVTVYAKWEANKYTIKFSANGGSGKMSSMTGCEYAKSYTLTKNAFTRKGYTFKGWNTNAKGTGTWYSNAASVKNLTPVNNKTVTLYAIWVKN